MSQRLASLVEQERLGRMPRRDVRKYPALLRVGRRV
jgi:hypothetical protein